MDSKNRNTAGTGVALMVGALMGWLISVLWRDKKTQLAEDVRHTIRHFKPTNKNLDMDGKLDAAFRMETGETIGIFKDIKSKLLEKLDYIKGTNQEINQDKYMETVDDIMRDFERRLNQSSGEQIKKIKDFLDHSYDLIKDELSRYERKMGE